MAAPNLNTPEGRAQIASRALRSYAAGMRRLQRTRPYAGPENANQRANLRAWADGAAELATLLDRTELIIEPPFGA